ncbi:lipase [Azorhizobium oxalatiphilum]|uniref:Lipase n=1 Tax=Azorhizobium oxalatiphilum TaxID=980631 RepID=A0A917FFV8_9HYPH|nr:lipase [Azorhizobium oxalatiphilum]
MLLVLLALAPPAHAQSDFYATTRADVEAGPPGTLIRMQPKWGAPDGAMAYRVLYRSTGLKGEPIPVSGVVIIPPGPPPPGGRPVVAWAHPTTGVVPKCAPSRQITFFRTVQGLRGMLARGMVVTATDYPGLGAGSIHPYLVGASEARAVLDSVRAVGMVPSASPSASFAVWGHSQGGQAALFTGLIAKDYAPELRLVGVAAAAPPTDLAVLLSDDISSAGGRNLTAMTLWSWSRLFNAPLTNVVTPAALPDMNELAEDCIERFWDVLERRAPTQALGKRFLVDLSFADTEPWRSLLRRNSPGLLPPGLPVFIAQGSADPLVRPDVTTGYVGNLCRHGRAVVYDVLPGVGHLFSGRDSADAAVDWMTDRFNGEPPASTCATP